MSTETIPLSREDIDGMVKDLDAAILSLVLTLGDGAPDEVCKPLRTMAGVRAMLNDALETNDDADPSRDTVTP